MTMTNPAIARTNLARAHSFIEAGRLDAAETALARALEYTASDRQYADVHALRAEIATARGNTQEALDAWYQVAGALRTILDCDDPDCPCANEGDGTNAAVLADFVASRLSLASIHAERMECFRAATAIDEAVGRLWPHQDEERFERLLEECLIVRTTELLHCGRLHEALGLAHELHLRASEMPISLRARAFEAIGRVYKDHRDCAAAADAFEAAAEAFAELVSDDPGVKERQLVAALEHGVERAHTGDHERAAAVLAEATAAAGPFEAKDPNWNEYLLQAYLASGDALEQLERCEEAADAYRSAAGIQKKESEPDSSRLSRILGSLADSLSRLKRFDEAHEALAEGFTAAGDDATDREFLFYLQGRILSQEHRCREAADAYASSAALAREGGERRRFELVRALNGIVDTAPCDGDADRAREAAEEAIDAVLADASGAAPQLAPSLFASLTKTNLDASAARLLDGLMRQAGDEGAPVESEVLAPVFDLCRSLDAERLRSICSALPDRGVILRLALGRSRA